MSRAQGAGLNNPETRWTRGGRLVLALGLLLLAWPLVTTLLSFSYPSDGWFGSYVQADDNYVLQLDLADRSSGLRAGDRVLAVGDQRVTPERYVNLRGLRVGETVRYTVLRQGQTLDVAVPLVTLSPLALLRYNWLSIQAGSTFSLVILLAAVIPALVFVRRPGNPAARLLFITFTYIVGEIWLNFPALNLYTLARPFPLSYAIWFYDSAWAWAVGSSLFLLSLVFPIRKAPLRRFPRLLPALLYGIPVLYVGVTTALVVTTFEIRWNYAFVALMAVLYLSAAAVLTVSLLHSYLTVREPVARAQLRWMGLGLGGGFGGLLVLYIGVGLLLYLGLLAADDPLTNFLYAVQTWIILLLPISLAVAITRYRLFDIDVLIRRTLIYSTLTALLALFYFGAVVVLQQLFRGLTGQGGDLVIILSTLAIAALFVPLRTRVQQAIDRRFYRRKYNTAHVLESFAATVRDEVDLNKLTENLMGVVEETMQPQTVSVWVKTDDARRKPYTGR